MKNEVVSVIVPIFNIEDYIERCVNSICAQSYTNLDIILIDDGSTDNSGIICDELAGRDVRIRVIHKCNGGLVSARKAGLEVAKGTYIGFVDGDDYIDVCFYETMLIEALKADVDFVHAGFVMEKKNNKHIFRHKNIGIYDNNLEICHSFIGKSICRGDYINSLYPGVCFKLFRKDFILECYRNIPDYLSYGEDTFNLAICMIKANKFSIMDSAYYHYCMRENSYTDYKNSVEIIEKIWKLYIELKRYFIENHLECLIETLEAFYLDNTLKIMKSKDVISSKIIYHSFNRTEQVRDKKIIIYGAGSVGQDYYAQICKYKDCDIVAWVDKNYDKYNFDYYRVESVDVIDNYEYDYIVIATVNSDYLNEIIEYLFKKGIGENKILY